MAKTNTMQKGKCAEFLVLAHLMKEGKEVAIPFGNQGRWDCLVEENGTWAKYQIKTSRKRSKRPSIYIDTVRSGNYSKTKTRSAAYRTYKVGDFDWLVAVDLASGKMWKIPASLIIGRRCITVDESSEYLWK